MKRALDLALRGAFHSMPNPSVGCVIVHQNKIIGEGFTSTYGGSHAEINALNAVRDIDQVLISDSTVYVTMEPCAHYGKTPPCALRLIQEKVKEVHIGVLDPNPKVSGKGVALLQQAQIKVQVGLLAEACQYHHRHFLQSILKNRSYVTLKWAESSDGYIAPSNTLETNKITWISTSWSQQFAHKLRAQHLGILVGSQTFKADRPELTTRHWAGRSPERFVISTNRNLFQCVSQPISGGFSILHIGGQLPTERVECESHDTKVLYSKDLREALEELYKAGFQSILVEGGTKTLQSFIEANLWDEAYVFKAAKELQSGIKAPSALQLKEIGSSKGDRILHALNTVAQA